MPIHLRPISRRKFLGRSLVLGAGLTLGRMPMVASPRPIAQDVWALLADTHLAADRTRVVKGVNMADNFTAVSRELLALPARPEAIFINGDCAFESGQAADYALVAEFLEPLRLG